MRILISPSSGVVQNTQIKLVFVTILLGVVDNVKPDYAISGEACARRSSAAVSF